MLRPERVRRPGTCTRSRSHGPLHRMVSFCVFAKEDAMATYIVLANFTDQGVRNAKDTLKRAEAFKELAKKHGVTVKDIYWTQGQYDIVTITEAADEMAATALALSIGGQGNIRTETLRAFSAEDMKTIIGKMA